MVCLAEGVGISGDPTTPVAGGKEFVDRGRRSRLAPKPSRSPPSDDTNELPKGLMILD